MITGGIVFRNNLECDNHSVTSVIYQTNRKTLERIAERALYQHGCLSERLIQRTIAGAEPEKSYTHVVYEADGGSLVMFANEGELNLLTELLEKAVGEEMMSSLRRKISEEENPIEVIAEQEAAKWRKEWPLEK